jgi:GNAT superfamily N-acetyltransferase
VSERVANNPADLAQVETVVDGQRVVFRPIRPEDKKLIRAGFERLSPQSRYRRFFRHIDHLSERDLRYLTEVDFVDHVAWIAVLADERGRPGVGVARWVRVRGEPTVAEGAVTVIDDWHNRGIGKTLLFLLARSARARGVEAFRAWVMGDNKPILGLLADQGIRYGQWDRGVVEIDVPLPNDPTDLADSAAPLVLREVARGRLEGEERWEGGRGTRLRGPAGG